MRPSWLASMPTTRVPPKVVALVGSYKLYFQTSDSTRGGQNRSSVTQYVQVVEASAAVDAGSDAP